MLSCYYQTQSAKLECYPNASEITLTVTSRGNILQNDLEHTSVGIWETKLLDRKHSIELWR